MHSTPVALAFASAVAAAACGKGITSTPPTGGDDAGATSDDGGANGDGGSGAWQPTKLTCSTPGDYDKNNWANRCGADRWSVKTGTDSLASSVGMTPTIVTTTDLVKLQTPPNVTYGTPRTPPVEITLYAVVDVKVQYVRLESDSDYHLVIAQGPYTMVTEVPFPGCIKGTSPWSCEISRARAAVDAKYHPTTQGASVQDTATIVGVGFWDFEHGQNGAAPNDIELHPIVAICFGAGCSPY